MSLILSDMPAMVQLGRDSTPVIPPGEILTDLVSLAQDARKCLCRFSCRVQVREQCATSRTQL